MIHFHICHRNHHDIHNDHLKADHHWKDNDHIIRMSIGSRDLSWRHKEGLLLPENKMMYADSSIGEGMDITIQVIVVK